MYSSDGQDRVTENREFPRPEPGAPCPLVLASEHAVILSYWTTETKSPDEYGPTVPIAFVVFRQPYAHQFGPPNEEAIAGHPLAHLGLLPLACFEVANSSWIRRLEQMNYAQAFEQLTHFVLTFHDSTFECAAHGFEVTVREIHQNEVLPQMLGALRDEDPGQRVI